MAGVNRNQRLRWLPSVLSVLARPTACWQQYGSVVRRAFTTTSPRMMPEGPEVKHLSDSIDRVVGGGRYALVEAQVRSGRYLDGARPQGWDEMLDLLPLEIEGCHSRGKFMYFTLVSKLAKPLETGPAIEREAERIADKLEEKRYSLWSTLGLTGWWSVDPTRTHTRVVLMARCVDKPDAAPVPLAYADMRNFGTLRFSSDQAELDAKLASLGLAWLDGECGWDAFRALAERTAARYPKRPLAVFLMDQAKTAGVGNYILSEALYRARVDPFASCGALDGAGWAALHAAISAVMTESFAVQGSGWRQRFALRVYARAADPEGRAVVRCTGPHKRSIYYVPEVQRVGQADAAPSEADEPQHQPRSTLDR